ncbi:hypothetical protein CAEBREN_28395 [Caenorhabditis brenneri]|uniref:Uncharacterized protein n=1 Tax=Caenorhabditis brenneri TaxID=135651 RepID=G0N5G4_CAEBE|nr:hypothetical protein CAEBREN_28395 [Caenorhabditis brenneri]
MKLISATVILSSFLLSSCTLEHALEDDISDTFIPKIRGNGDVIILDLSNIDHANGAEIPRNLTEEDTKIIPTNIDFAALKEAYAKENKAERFLPSRLFFDDEDKKKK